MSKLQQLKNNVEEVLDMYYNGVIDEGEEAYPQMTIEECRQYVIDQIYDMRSNGGGHTTYRKGICQDLKTLGNTVIYPVIDEYARGLDLIKE